jgi:hypothetical protein
LLGFAIGVPLAVTAQETYVPALGDIMGAIQERHIKLWFAGRRANWDLARYELEHIRTSLEDATLDRLEKSQDAAAALKGQQLEGDLKAAAEELTAKKAAFALATNDLAQATRKLACVLERCAKGE